MIRTLGLLGAGPAWSFGVETGITLPSADPGGLTADATVEPFGGPPTLMQASRVGMSRAAMAVMRTVDPHRALAIQGGARGSSVGLGPPSGGGTRDRAIFTGDAGGPPVAAIAAGVLGLGALAFVAIKMLGKGRRR